MKYTTRDNNINNEEFTTSLHLNIYLAIFSLYLQIPYFEGIIPNLITHSSKNGKKGLLTKNLGFRGKNIIKPSKTTFKIVFKILLYRKLLLRSLKVRVLKVL